MTAARALLSTAEAADLTGLSTEWFYLARKKGDGPPYLRVTSRIVKYDRDDLLSWFRQFRVGQ
jgi:predicted DNA-binding transcriptional regulator AlpA